MGSNQQANIVDPPTADANWRSPHGLNTDLARLSGRIAE